MKRILVVFFFIFNAAFLLAQKRQDVLYLKNGSIIRGDIEQLVVGSHVKIKTYDHSIWAFQFSEVDSITKENRKALDYKSTKSGMYAGASFVGLAGNFSVNKSFRSEFGYHFKEKNAVAINLGIDFFDYALYHTSLGYRRYLNKSHSSPFLMLHGGYSLPAEVYFYSSKSIGGVNAGSAVGITHFLSSGVALDVSLGYNFQKNVIINEYLWWWGEVIDHRTITYYNRIALRIGLLFK